MRVLFICHWNRFRSKIAESIFVAKAGKEYETRSAGLRIYTDPTITKRAAELLEENGYKTVSKKSMKVTQQLIDWADKIVVVADDVSTEIFPREKTEVWRIVDCEDEFDFDCTRKTFEQIEARVNNFVKFLNLARR